MGLKAATIDDRLLLFGMYIFVKIEWLAWQTMTVLSHEPDFTQSWQCLKRLRRYLLSPSLISPFSKFSFLYLETSHNFMIDENW